MRHPPWGACALVLAVAISPARAQTPCATDREIVAIVSDTMLKTYLVTLGTCLKRYPELGTKGLAAFKMFRDTYLNMITGAERSAAAAFERMYPGQGEAARAENGRAPSQEAMQAASRMSSRECSNVVTGFEAMAVADDFSVVVPRAMIQAGRGKVPRC